MVLYRADDIFLASDLQTGGKNSQGHKTGAELYALYRSDQNRNVYVGRTGGLSGKTFEEDIKSGRWLGHYYEFTQGKCPANRNWFSLEDFYNTVNEISAERTVGTPSEKKPPSGN